MIKLSVNLYFISAITCFVLGLIGYVSPVSDDGMSLTEADEKCQSKTGFLNQKLDEKDLKYCNLAKFFNAIYFLFGLGFVLIGIGYFSQMKNKKKN